MGKLEAIPVHSPFNWVEANKQIRRSGLINAKGCKIEIPSVWNIELFEELLSGYEDMEIIKYLHYGWPVELSKKLNVLPPPVNQKGARDNPDKVLNYLEDEIKNGSILGPLQVNPFGSCARFSPIDAIPKKDSQDLRIILNHIQLKVGRLMRL